MQQQGKRRPERGVNISRRQLHRDRDQPKEEPYLLLIEQTAESRSEQLTHLLSELLRSRWHIHLLPSKGVLWTPWELSKFLTGSEVRPSLTV